MLLVIIKCKNNKTIFFYLSFIFSYLKNVFKKIKQISKQTKKLTVLRSPHVHKIAQQQFEQKIIKKHILFISFDKIKLLFFFKKLLTLVYQDINLNYYFICKNNNLTCFFINYLKLYFLFFLNKSKKYKFKLHKIKQIKLNKTLNYLKMLNFLGKNFFCKF